MVLMQFSILPTTLDIYYIISSYGGRLHYFYTDLLVLYQSYLLCMGPYQNLSTKVSIISQQPSLFGLTLTQELTCS